MIPLGDHTIGQTIHVPYSTNAASGASVAPTSAGAVRVYRDGGATERTSSSGITVVSNPGFDAVAGLNGILIDTTDDSDPGFYAPGHDYWVAVVGAEIDGQTVNAFVAAFSIRNRSDTALYRGFLQAATATTLTLPASAPDVANALLHARVRIVAGTGAGQSRLITAYASGRVATVDTLSIVPDTTSFVEIEPVGLDAISQDELNSGVWGYTTRALTDKEGFEIASTDFNTTLDPIVAALDDIQTNGVAVDEVAVQAAVQLALEAFNLDHLVKLAVDTDFATTVHADSVVGHLANKVAATAGYDRATDSLEGLADRPASGGPTAEEIADAVWDEAIAGHATAGSTGKVLADNAAGITVMTGRLTDARAVLLDKLAGLPMQVAKNTALPAFPFPMFSSANGRTPQPNLTVTAERSIDGGAFGACANPVTAIGNGTYKIDLAASDLNGDRIIFRFSANGADDTLVTILTNSTP